MNTPVHHHSHDDQNRHQKKRSHSASRASVRSLWTAFIVTGFFALVEAFGGTLSKSLALTSDAAHMGTDVLGIGISLIALWTSARSGKRHAEKLGAIFSTLIIWFTAGAIATEALERLNSPQSGLEIKGGLALAISALGLVANLVSLKALHGQKEAHVNVHAAYLHVVVDLAGSVAAILSALLVLWTGNPLIDAWLSFLLVAGILWSSGRFVTSKLLGREDTSPHSH